MGELSLKNTEFNQVLGSIIETIQSTDNIIDIFRHTTEQLLESLKCDYICILFNNEKARYFYINHALSPSPSDHGEDVIIPYSETSVTEVLRTHQPILRNDLSGRGQLTPGDLKFLANGVRSDLSVPVVNKNKVLAVINLSSYKNEFFKQFDAVAIHQVAMLLGLALERSDLIDQLRLNKADMVQWKKKFSQLIEHSSEAIALVRRDYDLIYLSNPAFQKMTGFEAADLSGMRLSQLHPEHTEIISGKLQNDAQEGTIADFVPLTLLRKDGVALPVKFRFAGIPDENFVFAFYEEAMAGNYPPAPHPDRGEFSLEFIQRGLAVATASQFDRLLDFIADEYGSKMGARYIAIQLVNEKTGELDPVRIKRFPDNFNFTKLKPWQIGLDQPPLRQVLQKNEALIINDIWKEPEFSSWLPIAQGLGYAALVSVPIQVDDAPIGAMTLFYERRQHFSDSERGYFTGLGSFFSFLIEKSQQSMAANHDRLLLSALADLSELIKFDSDLTGIIKGLLLAMSKVTPFDYAQVTLFDSPAENMQTFTVISDACRKLLPHQELVRLEGSDLCWLDISRMSLREQLEQKDDQNELIEGKILSRLSYVLMAQNRYLGTIVIGKLEANCYSEKHARTFNKMAQYGSAIMENARWSLENGRPDREPIVAPDFESPVFSDLNVANNSKTVVHGTASLLGADLVTLRLMKENKPLADLMANQSIMEIQKFLKFEDNQILPHIFKGADYHSLHQPVDADSSSRIKSTVLPLNFQSYFGFALKLNADVLGLVSIYWYESRQVSTDELSRILYFSSQAASAMHNARNYEAAMATSAELQKINSELENFVYTVSHDLKTPIVSIQGFSSILLNEMRHDLAIDSYKYLERIQQNANKMERMITDLLELSRVGRVVNPFEEAPMYDVVTLAVNELLFSLKEKKIKLMVDKAMPKLLCDKARMVQAFLNLVSNAIKYIGENNPSPQIRIGYRGEKSSHLFFVRDNGIGIHKQFHEKIFMLFQRANQEAASDEEGSGIGLAIVKKIVEHHNGKVWVESQPGNGSTFYLSFPRESL